MDMKGIMGEKWLRYKVCWGLGKWDSGAVECEIEVLYDILALGVLEKMKIHPLIAMPAKVEKAGFALAVSGALAGQLWPALPRSGSWLSALLPAWLWAGFALACTVHCIARLLYYAHFVQSVK